ARRRAPAACAGRDRAPAVRSAGRAARTHPPGATHPAAPPAPLPHRSAHPVRRGRGERPDRAQPGLHRPSRAAGRHRARAARAPPAGARRAHRHLRRTRRGRVPHQRTRQHRTGPGQPRRPARRAAVAHRRRSEPMTTSKSGKDKTRKKAARKKAAPKPTGMEELKFMVDSAWERRSLVTPEEMEGSTGPVVERVIEGLESGELRVAEPDGKGGWTVNEWLKKAVLLYFRVQDMELVESYPSPFWDKIPLRFEEF